MPETSGTEFLQSKNRLSGLNLTWFFSTFRNGDDHANVLFFFVLSYCLVSVWVVNRADDMPLEFMKLSIKKKLKSRCQILAGTVTVLLIGARGSYYAYNEKKTQIHVSFT